MDRAVVPSLANLANTFMQQNKQSLGMALYTTGDDVQAVACRGDVAAVQE